MAEISKSQYLSLRHPYEPEIVKLAIIAESPPASGLYFYNAEGRTSEPLFKALMKQLNLSPLTKDEGLRALRQSGWILIDATYRPVDKLKGSQRDDVILKDYPLLVADLTNLLSDQRTQLILIKANVCRILEPKLKADGFNVINHQSVIYFPANGHQKEFMQKFAEVLTSAKV